MRDSVIMFSIVRIVLSAGVVSGTTACSGGPACPEGAFKNSGDPAFCVKLPAGFTAQPARKYRDGMAISFRGKSLIDTFDVVWEKGKDYDAANRTAANIESKDYSLVAKGEVPVGTGKFWHYTSAASKSDWFLEHVKGKEYLYTCEIQTRGEGDTKAKIEACKSLIGP